MRGAIVSASLRWWRDVVEMCYPGACAVCRRECDSGSLLCDACDAELAQIEAYGRCPRCAAPLPESVSLCPYCRDKGLHPLDDIACMGVFDGPLKALVHHAKYHSRWTLLEHLSDRLARRGDVAEVLNDADAIVPVPLHWHRQIARGFNQADVLAVRLTRAGRRVGNPRLRVRSSLIRVRDTTSQTRFHARTARAENIRGAFAVDRPEAIAGKRLVLVDDVMTTGATLREAARTLGALEPLAISAIVLAVADPRGRGFTII